MHTITQAAMPLKLIGAILALTFIAALAITLSGGASAQSPDNIYDDPQPCGPGAQTAFQPEPHEIHEGHFALFDAYWFQFDVGDSAERDGILHTNECPPLVSTSFEIDPNTNLPVETILLSESNIDVDEAIFHILDGHKATVVRGTAVDSETEKQISSDEYIELDLYADPGDEVWWLRLDDPDTDEDETSALTLGFSTKRFDDQYWVADDGAPPLRYKFELERNPGIDPNDHPHFLAYRADPGGEDPPELVWDSAAPDTADMMLAPGQLEELQWVFTKPGTYELWVHLQGHVRQLLPPGADEDWRPISGNETRTETSEIKRYVIQVGTELTVNNPPAFLMERSVAENSAAGAAVGAAIPVHDPDGDPLSYRLSGPDSALFALSGATDGNGRFTEPPTIVTAANALDHEARPHHFLTLHVSDGKGITNYDNQEIDNAVRVKVNVADVDETNTGGFVELIPSAATVKVGEKVSIRANIGDLPAGATNPVLRWNVEDPPDADPLRSAFSQDFTRAFTYDTPGPRSFYVGLFYTRNGFRPPGHLSDKITVTWVADGN